MTKTILTLSQILDLMKILRNLFTHHRQIREKTRLGSLIQYPKVPPFLSESIVFHLLESGVLLGKPTKTRKSVTGGDLEIHSEDGILSRVEVKATGESAFQFFSDKDLDAHLLIWVHFDNVFRDTTQRGFNIYRIEQARKYFPRPRKITLADFLKAGGKNVLVVRVQLDSLKEPR